MFQLPTRTARVAVLGALFAVAPGVVGAQEAEAPVCTATVEAAALPAGEAAVELTFSLSEAIGEVTAIEAGESGISIASPEDAEPTEMATDEEAPEATEMATEGMSTAVVWLSTLEAHAGTYEISLIGAEGTCKAEITVEGEGA